MRISLKNTSHLIVILAISILFANCQSNNNIDKKNEYLNHIGYLDSADPDFTADFERCSDSLPIGFYSSAAPHAYKGTKRTFVNYVHKNYKNQGFSDNGFLNLRFLINCDGNIGHMEVNELDEDYLSTDLNDEMVEQLIDLSANGENWRLPNRDKPYDVYMYLIYKIENGNITEILP